MHFLFSLHPCRSTKKTVNDYSFFSVWIILLLLLCFLLFIIFHGFYLLYKFFCRIKHSISLNTTDITPFAFFVMFESTCFTKVMFALGNNWILKWFPANKTGKWKVIIIITVYFISMWILFAVVSFFPFTLQLPSMLIITAIMQKFTTVSKTTKTSFLVVLAYVGLVIPADCCTQISWGPDRSLPKPKV